MDTVHNLIVRSRHVEAIEVNVLDTRHGLGVRLWEEDGYLWWSGGGVRGQPVQQGRIQRVDRR